MKCDYQAMADSSIWCKAHDREWSECLSAEIVSLKETNTRLNRRCQEAERAANVKVEEIRKQGGSLGRALATWSAGDLRRRLEETELQKQDLRKALGALAKKVRAVNKDIEYLFVFAANHSLGQYKGAQYDGEIDIAEKLLAETVTERPKCDHVGTVENCHNAGKPLRLCLKCGETMTDKAKREGA